jgi:monoamine oxidase
MALSRRHFLERLAGTAGATMTYQAMTALGLLSVPAAAEDFELRGHGGSTPVLILGAGLAGMATAYELGKLGYDCRILEARTRPGGRCHTIRPGTASEEAGATEVAGFDEGLYYNPGPMRIPHHHHTTLGYCRELQVPVEVFVNDNEAAYLYQSKTAALAGRRLRSREVRADLSGYVAELLSKAISAHALDEPLTDADRQAFLEYLRKAGALNEKAAYSGTARRGYDTPPGAGDLPGGSSKPLALDELLGSKTGFYLQTEYLQQATMFQVVGGTDRLAAAFAARLGGRITYGAEVREIHQDAEGVSVAYIKDSHEHRATAAYAVCAMPLVVLASLQGADFAPDVKTAIASVPYSAAGKIGLQFKRRFWEEDDAIFGGISKTDQEIAQIVYPSSGFLGSKGILIGYYQNGANATAMARRPPQERLAAALSQGELIHPQYKKEFETAFSVSWQNVPWNKGGWAQYSLEARQSAYPVFLRPDGRFYFAGDHVSYMSGWMTGALESGRQVAASIHARTGRESTRSAA